MEQSMESSVPQSHSGKWLAIIGIVIQVFGYVMLMMVVMDSVAEVADMGFGTPGIVDPSHMAGAMNGMTRRFFDIIFISQAIGGVGNFLFVFSLVSCRYRAVWFFWFICIWGVLSAPSFPLGTGFGIFFLVYALSRKEEFLKTPQASPSLS